MFRITLIVTVLAAPSVALAQQAETPEPEQAVVATAACTADEVHALVEQMTDVSASVEDRWAAEDELLLCDPRLVLPELLEHVDKGMPKGGIWNSGGRELDKDAPIEWQSHYAVSRVWRRATHGLGDRNEQSAFLINLLPAAGSRAQARLLNSAMWTTHTEVAAECQLTDPNAASLVKVTSWKLLTQHRIDGCHELAVRALRQTNEAPLRSFWIGTIFEDRRVHRTECDPRVVEVAFDSIDALSIQNLALYIGVDLPGESLEQRRSAALAWWADNKERIQAEAAEWDARPQARGTRDAFKDLAEGKLAIRTWGMPPTWEFDARKMMQQRLGFTYEGAYCMTTEEMQAYDDAYNLIMESAIRRKHGPDWKDQVAAIREEAKERWNKDFGMGEVDPAPPKK